MHMYLPMLSDHMESTESLVKVSYTYLLNF